MTPEEARRLLARFAQVILRLVTAGDIHVATGAAAEAGSLLQNIPIALQAANFPQARRSDPQLWLNEEIGDPLMPGPADLAAFNELFVDEASLVISRADILDMFGATDLPSNPDPWEELPEPPPVRVSIWDRLRDPQV